MTDVTPPPEAEGIPTFAEETRLRAHEVLTELSARSTSIEGQIESLRIQLESVSKQQAEAQLVLDALDGKLVRTDDATRHEPSTAAPVRADWHAPEIITPQYAELVARAKTWIQEHDAPFTLTDLTQALWPDDLLAAEPATSDAVLTELLNADLIMVDHNAKPASVVTYVKVEPPDPGVTRTSPPTDELESSRSEEGGVQPKSEEGSPETGEGATLEDSDPARAGSDTGEETQQLVEEIGDLRDDLNVVDEAVLEHVTAHPRSRRDDIMSALTLTDIAAAQSLSRLVKAGKAKIVGENPTRWSAAEAEPAAAPQEAPVELQSRRNSEHYLSLELVRDMARDYEREHGTPWKKPELAEYMSGKMGREVKAASIQDYTKELAESGVLNRTGGKRGPGVRYQYQKPSSNGGPSSRPRHDHPRATPKVAGGGSDIQRGEAVAHTGRAKGRAGKSGVNKKKQQLGFRVKSARGDRNRAG